MDDTQDKTLDCIKRLRSLTVPGKNLPGKEVKKALSDLQGLHPQYRFYYDKLYLLVVVGPPDCRLTLPPYLYNQADLVLVVQEDAAKFRCDILKDRDGVIETVGQRYRVMQAAFGLPPTGRLDDASLAAMAGVVEGAPKLTEEEIEALLEDRRNRYGRNLKNLKG